MLRSSFLDVPVPTEVVSPLAVPESALPEEELVPRRLEMDGNLGIKWGVSINGGTPK